MNSFVHAAWFRWNPNKDLIAVAISWLLVVAGLSMATFIITGQKGGLYFLIYAVLTALLFGIGIPVAWMVFVRKQSTTSLGITKKNLSLSLGIQLILSIILYILALSKTTFPAFNYLMPLITLTLAIGFFEAVFWRGWVLLRLEEAFGLIPALILSSVLYAAYHIGYGMPLSEMIFLFFIGLLFAVVFRITKNVFILWPVFQPMGQLITLMKESLPLPLIAAVGFTEVLAVMVFAAIFVPFIAQKKGVVLAR